MWTLRMPGVLDAFEVTIDDTGTFFARGKNYGPDAASWSGAIDAECNLIGELHAEYAGCVAHINDTGRPN